MKMTARRTLIIAGSLTALLALTAFAPAAMADGERKQIKEDRKEIKQDKKDLKDDREQLRADLKEYFAKRLLKVNTTLDLSGSGVGRDNATYSFTINATGMSLLRLKDRDGDFKVLRGEMVAHVVLYGANGTIVKEGDMRLKVLGRHSDDGWKWQVQSVGKRPNGMPRLVLRGDAEKVSPGVFDLKGTGHMAVKLGGSEKASPIKVTEVSGVFTREVPKPAALSPTPTSSNAEPEPAAASG